MAPRAFTTTLALWMALGAAACSDDGGEEVAPGRGVGEPQRAQVTEPVSGQVGARPHGPGVAMTTQRRVGGEHVQLEATPASPITVTETQEVAAETQRVRDPSAELRRMMGDPSACLTEADRHIGRDVSFQVEVDTVRSGIVVGARATAPGVSEEAIECVRRRASALRFEPFEDRGRTIQTALILRLTPTEPPPQ